MLARANLDPVLRMLSLLPGFCASSISTLGLADPSRRRMPRINGPMFSTSTLLTVEVVHRGERSVFACSLTVVVTTSQANQSSSPNDVSEQGTPRRQCLK